MKLLHSIFLFVPWLVSCDPVTIHVFEPQVSGVPVRTPEARSRLRTAVEGVARRHELVQWPTGLRVAPIIRDETLALYGHPPDSGSSSSLDLVLIRDHSSGTDKVQIIEWRFTRSDESKAVEREIQASLP